MQLSREGLGQSLVFGVRFALTNVSGLRWEFVVVISCDARGSLFLERNRRSTNSHEITPTRKLTVKSRTPEFSNKLLTYDNTN